jgi:Uma2 family endonuclease
MAMPHRIPLYTVEQVRAFPADGNRYELVEGFLLVTPSPTPVHQIVAFRLACMLDGYLRRSGLARVVTPGEIEVEPDLHLEPDVLVLPAGFPIDTPWRAMSGWWLAAEVVSPSSKHYDREFKHDAYLAAGLEEYWIVDPKSRSIEVSAQDGRRRVRGVGRVAWHPPAQSEPLVLDPSELFAGVP